jgi:hypothetical protein
MKTKDEILNRILELKNDELLSYRAATVFANAPLALMQTSLLIELHTLEWVLDLPKSILPLAGSKKKQEVSN